MRMDCRARLRVLGMVVQPINRVIALSARSIRSTLAAACLLCAGDFCLGKRDLRWNSPSVAVSIDSTVLRIPGSRRMLFSPKLGQRGGNFRQARSG